MCAISYDSIEVLAGFTEKHGITYPLLSDEGSSAIRRLGLLNKQVFEQHAAFGIPRRDNHEGVPYPGIFILDEQGVVVEKRFLQNYRERETAAAVLEQAFGSESAVRGPVQRLSAPGVAVRAYLDAPTYRIFQRRWLTVELQIEPGLHLYGRPIPEGYVPLSLEVEAEPQKEGLVAGEMQGPSPRAFRVAGLDEEFVVYEGTAVFRLPLTFNRKLDVTELSFTLRYQACSESDCLMPAELTLTVPVQAENLVDLDR